MTGTSRFYALANLFIPRTATRIMNVLHRTFPAGDAPTAFPVEKALLTKLFGGSPL